MKRYSSTSFTGYELPAPYKYPRSSPSSPHTHTHTHPGPYHTSILRALRHLISPIILSSPPTMEDICTSRFAWLLQISSATRTLAAQLCSLNSDPSQDPELALERAMHLMFDLVSNQMHALGAQENSIVRLGSQLNWQDDRFDTDSTPQHGPHLVEHGALPLGPSKSFLEVYEFDGRPPVDDALRHSRYALIAGMKVVIYQIADKYESVQNALKKLWWHLMGEMTTNHYLITWHDGFVIAQA
jgi:hypothetical protein